MNTKEEILEAAKLIKWLVIITAILFFSNIINEFLGRPSWHLDRFIDVRYESNFPTWFSGMLLALAAYYAYKCSVTAKDNKSAQRMLQLLSLGLLGISCDEVAMIHEHLGMVVNKYFFKIETINQSEWIVLLGPIILIVIIIFSIKIRTYLKGSARAMKFLFIGMLIYISGAFILESTINLFNYNSAAWLNSIENITEEFCEIIGTIFLIKGLMEHNKFLLSKTEAQ